MPLRKAALLTVSTLVLSASSRRPRPAPVSDLGRSGVDPCTSSYDKGTGLVGVVASARALGAARSREDHAAISDGDAAVQLLDRGVAL